MTPVNSTPLGSRDLDRRGLLSVAAVPQNRESRARASWAAALACFVLAASSVSAQPTPAPAPAPLHEDDPHASEAVKLSPYEVRTDKDTGFVASSALSGGRLNVSLENTPAAYSVLTRDFIDALQLTDMNDMAGWTPNVARALDQGFDATFGRYDAALTARGLRSNLTEQRDFFIFGLVNSDSYNVERLDVGRGPNAILFGNGNYGAVANLILKRAKPTENFEDIRYSYGSYGNQRAAIDINRSLNDTLAIRVNGVYKDRGDWMDFNWERERAGTAALTWRPLAKTEVRVSFEKGQRELSIVRPNTTEWFDVWDGTSFSGYHPASQAASVASHGAFISDRGGSAGAGWTIIPGLGSSTIYSQEGQVRTDTGAYGAWGFSSILNAVNRPASVFDTAIAKSHFTLPSRSYAQGFDGPTGKDHFDDSTIAIQQQVGENLFFEVAGNYNRLNNYLETSSNNGMDTMNIDVNQTLSNGQVNPYYLQPFYEAIFNTTTDAQINSTNVRASAAYVLPNTRFGSFRFNVMGGRAKQTEDKIAELYVVHDNGSNKVDVNNSIMSTRWYLNDKARPLVMPNRVTLVTPVIDGSGNVVSTQSRTVDAGYVTNISKNNGNNRTTDTNFDYVQASASGSFFNEKLDVFASVRRDEYKVSRQSSLNANDYPSNWDGHTRYFLPAAPADYFNLTYQPYSSDGVTRLAAIPARTRPRISSGGFSVPDPRYANDRFQSDYSAPDIKGKADTYNVGSVYHTPIKGLSVFVNYGTTFNPPQPQPSIYGYFFDPVVSKGYDFGVSYSALDGKLFAKLTRYTGTQKGIVINNSNLGENFGNDINAVINANPVGLLDTSPGAINKRGLLPVPGYSDSIDSDLHGYEFEVVANLTKNWRMMANAALPRAYQTHVFPLTQQWLKDNDSTLRQILDDAGVQLDSNGIASAKPGVTTATSPDLNTSIAAWNRLVAAKTIFALGGAKQEQYRATESIVNLFTDYRFNDGVLKGLRVGAGANYQGKNVLGYKGANTIVDPSNSTKAIDDPTVSALDPVYQPGYWLALATVGYEYKISKKVTASLDLRIDNLFNYSKPIYSNVLMVPPAGNPTSPARQAVPDLFGYNPPRRFTLTAALQF